MPNFSMTCHALCKHEDMSEEIETIVQIRHCFYVFPDPGLKDYRIIKPSPPPFPPQEGKGVKCPGIPNNQALT